MTVFKPIVAAARTVFATAAMLFALTGAAMAFTPGIDLTAQQTLDMQAAGQTVIVDVRTEPEWRETGIAAGAVTLSMLDPAFVAKLAEIQDANPGKSVAFICRSGNRSAQVQSVLAQHGYAEMFSVWGGMGGNGDGATGWVAEGLPVTAWPAL